jgi:hypothetical protein
MRVFTFGQICELLFCELLSRMIEQDLVDFPFAFSEFVLIGIDGIACG